MEKIKITFLGTSASIPTKKRNHPAILLNYKNENILFDCGEGTQRQFKFAKLSPMKLTRIFITHWHGDHTLGLLGLIETLTMQGYSKILHIYGPTGTKKYFSLLKPFLGPYEKIKIELHEITNQIPFETPEFEIQTMPMKHGIPSLAYSFQIKDKLRLDKAKLKKLKLPHSPLLKKLQEGKDATIEGKKITASQVTYSEPGRKIALIMDTAPNPDTTKIAKDSDLLICESSFTQSEKEMAEKKKHLTAKDAATIAKTAKAKKLVLTHLSPRYDLNAKPVEDEAKKVFKNVSIARDFEIIEI